MSQFQRTNKDLYFSLLPTDLLSSLLLLFDSTELLQILQQLEDIPDFDMVFQSKYFWIKLWRRDISLFLDLPANPYENYREIIIDSLEINDRYKKIKYLGENGYDRLLMPMLANIDDYELALVYAARRGHIGLAKLMLALGAENYNWAMREAATGGHMDIVNLMLDKGATSYNEALYYAVKNGHMDIVKLMLQLGARVSDHVANSAKTEKMRSLLRSYRK